MRTPILCSTSTTAALPRARGRGSPPPCPGPRERRAGPSRASTPASPASSRPRACAARGVRGDRGVTRKVQPLEHGDDRGQRQDVDVASACDLLLAAHRLAVDADALEPGRHGSPEGVRDADSDLEVARVGRLVPEDDEVEGPVRRLVAADGVDDRGGRRLRVPLLSVRDEVDRAVGAERHRIAELLLGLRSAQA